MEAGAARVKISESQTPVPVQASNRFLDPAVLAGISGLDLVAKTVVDGFVAGLHRSPDFGFSQEFEEYRVLRPATIYGMSIGTFLRARNGLT